MEEEVEGGDVAVTAQRIACNRNIINVGINGFMSENSSQQDLSLSDAQTL